MYETLILSYLGSFTMFVKFAFLTFAVNSFVFYMLPSIIAFFRGHTNIIAIFIVNLLFGWMLWWVCLIWAIVGKQKKINNNNNIE